MNTNVIEIGLHGILDKLWSTFSIRDWTEDFEQKDGDHINICAKCFGRFRGNKNKVICKTCAGK